LHQRDLLRAETAGSRAMDADHTDRLALVEHGHRQSRELGLLWPQLRPRLGALVGRDQEAGLLRANVGEVERPTLAKGEGDEGGPFDQLRPSNDVLSF